MKIALPKLRTSHLITNEEALRRCQTALEQKDREDYVGAQDTMRRLWRGVGQRPETKGLHAPVAAEALLCVGILTGWIGSKNQIKNAQETAKNLITESINYFESAGDVMKIAAARVELAYCYWRDGELNEARIMVRESLNKLTTEGTTRARAFLKLVIIENSAARHVDALKLLTENASLFEKVTNHTVKGDYHNELAITLEEIAASEKRNDYFQRAIEEYESADHHFKLARNVVFRASVKNNLAVLLSSLSRFKEAYKYLDEAKRLTASFGDKAKTAQIDWTRAEVLIAEGKLKEAERVAHKAASVLEKGGHQCVLADVLITQGIALARASHNERAQFIFQKAIEAAYKVGALNKAGLAALTLIEEVDQLAPATLQAAYQQAREWLADSQSQGVLLRLNKAAGKFVSSVRSELSAEDATEILLTKNFDLQEKMLEYERAMIRQALTQANGSVTHAASLLGLSHQGLGYVIENRHKDLLRERSPIRRRARKN
ncbi:MAG: helix-turn-helix domain-containing protein [Pyrinomonadaceae bacterium]